MRIIVNGQEVRVAGKAAKTIRSQPGYIRSRFGNPVANVLSRTDKGGIRLYRNVNGRLMDGSLRDIDPEDLPGITVE